MKCCNAQDLAPFDLAPAWVDHVDDTLVEPGESDSPDAIEYEPSGWTDVMWDGQTTVGYGCRNCGKVRLIDRITIDSENVYERVRDHSELLEDYRNARADAVDTGEEFHVGFAHGLGRALELLDLLAVRAKFQDCGMDTDFYLTKEEKA